MPPRSAKGLQRNRLRRGPERDRSSTAGSSGQNDRLPALMADLVRRGGRDRYGWRSCYACGQSCDHDDPDRRSASAATRSGWAWSPALPGRAATHGINFFTTELVAKRLGLLHELVPKAVRVAVLVNPANLRAPRPRYESVPEAARDHRTANSGPQRQHQPRDRGSLRHSCTRACRRPVRCPRWLLHQPTRPICDARDALWDSRDLYPREIVEVGGLMSYGTDTSGYVSSGRASMLAASSRARSPPTCRSCSRPSSSWSSTSRPPRRLASTVPPTLLARADEVIE